MACFGMSLGVKRTPLVKGSLSNLQIARFSLYGVNIKREALHTPIMRPYVREEAGTHRRFTRPSRSFDCHGLGFSL